MNVQTLLAVIVLLVALVYTVKRMRKNWKTGDVDQRCEKCDIPDMLNNQK